MSYDANTPVVNVAPRISKTAFVAWLRSVNSPAADTGAAGYDAIVANTVDPLFCLACFNHESNAATNPAAIVVKYGTNNPGNCRSTRTGAGHVINTERGPFVAYPNWYEGWRDLAFRLIDPAYVYMQGGCTTPGKIVPKFAPESDGNDPNGYLQSVLTFMNQHADWEGDTAPVAQTDDDAATWQASSNFDAGRNGSAIDRIILHTTEGSFDSALGWLRGAASGSSNRDSSTHYLISADGARIAQLVREADTAWAAGNLAFNRRGVNIEQEGYASRGGFSDGLYQATGTLVGRVARRHGVPLDRQHVIGHMDVPDPNNPSLKGGVDHHGDPGPHFDFDRVLQIAGNVTTDTTQSEANQPRWFPETRHYLSHGFLHFWEENGGLAIFGLPLSEEFTGPEGFTIQWLERARFEYQPKIAGNQWGVVLGRLGADSLDADKKQHPSAFADAEPPH